jgi:hypothetical protein
MIHVRNCDAHAREEELQQFHECVRRCRKCAAVTSECSGTQQGYSRRDLSPMLELAPVFAKVIVQSSTSLFTSSM